MRKLLFIFSIALCACSSVIVRPLYIIDNSVVYIDSFTIPDSYNQIAYKNIKSFKAAAGVTKERKRSERERINRDIDYATSLVTGKSMSEAKAMRLEREAARKAEAKEIYNIILSGDYNDVNLQRINDYINESTPRNPYGRRLSQRLPQAVERSLLERDRGNAQDALYSRAAEGASGTDGKISEGTKRAVKAKKIGTAEAAGHCSMKSFTGQQ